MDRQKRRRFVNGENLSHFQRILVPGGNFLFASDIPDYIDWTPFLIKKAVLWLCEQTGKALLKLNDLDFTSHGLHELLRHHGPAQKVSHQVFQWMMNTIDYHPAGKDPKRVICFSPHPDDDVISMGGTLIRLCDDGHETHIAYMTSGNIAVFDHDARRFADFVGRAKGTCD